jgi:hypothetical protein
MSDGTLTVAGPITNNGTIRLYGTPALSSTGSFTNNGVLDLINSPPTLPANFVNNGTVLDSSGVKVESVSVSGTNVTVTVQSHTGHTYQLQKCDSFISGVWQDVGAARSGVNGTVLTFTEARPPGDTTGFYRVIVSP